MTISLAINAATGRMGKELLKTIVSDSEVTVASALARASHPLLGTDIGYLIGANPQGTKLSSDPVAGLKSAQVLIDFSLPEHSIDTLNHAVNAKIPMVIGTTGFDDKQKQHIQEAAKTIPILIAANFSLGVNALIKLAQDATKLLGKKADIEIFEAHHKHKLDSPSGTALAIGEVIAQQKGQQLNDIATYDRSGERIEGDIGFSVMRAGEIIGTHEVTFALDGEILSLRHEAQSRQCFAQGAIETAKWLFGQTQQGKRGIFSIQQMLSEQK